MRTARPRKVDVDIIRGRVERIARLIRNRKRRLKSAILRNGVSMDQTRGQQAKKRSDHYFHKEEPTR